MVIYFICSFNPCFRYSQFSQEVYPSHQTNPLAYYLSFTQSYLFVKIFLTLIIYLICYQAYHHIFSYVISSKHLMNLDFHFLTCFHVIITVIANHKHNQNTLDFSQLTIIFAIVITSLDIIYFNFSMGFICFSKDFFCLVNYFKVMERAFHSFRICQVSLNLVAYSYFYSCFYFYCLIFVNLFTTN